MIKIDKKEVSEKIDIKNTAVEIKSITYETNCRVNSGKDEFWNLEV